MGMLTFPSGEERILTRQESTEPGAVPGRGTDDRTRASPNVARRLAMIRYCQEVSGNVAKPCRYYGVSRPTYNKWLRRYEEHGVEGLRDTSSRPQSSPNATRTEVLGEIIYLR